LLRKQRKTLGGYFFAAPCIATTRECMWAAKEKRDFQVFENSGNW